MSKSLSFDAVFTALTVLSVEAMMAGCSKTESAAPAPETNTTASGSTTASPKTAAQSSSQTLPAAAAPSVAAVDAGKEIEPSASPQKKKAAASCGATGCSPEMKKNGK